MELLRMGSNQWDHTATNFILKFLPYNIMTYSCPIKFLSFLWNCYVLKFTFYYLCVIGFYLLWHMQIKTHIILSGQRLLGNIPITQSKRHASKNYFIRNASIIYFPVNVWICYLGTCYHVCRIKSMLLLDNNYVAKTTGMT